MKPFKSDFSKDQHQFQQKSLNMSDGARAIQQTKTMQTVIWSKKLTANFTLPKKGAWLSALF